MIRHPPSPPPFPHTPLSRSPAAFVPATIAQESARGTSARHRQYGEPYLLALGRLIARNRRRYGGYVVHTGIVMLFVAFSGMAFKTETEATLRPGESVSLRSPYGSTYTFTHLGISQYDALNRLVTAAAVRSEEHTSELQSRLHLVCRL